MFPNCSYLPWHGETNRCPIHRVCRTPFPASVSISDTTVLSLRWRFLSTPVCHRYRCSEQLFRTRHYCERVSMCPWKYSSAKLNTRSPSELTFSIEPVAPSVASLLLVCIMCSCECWTAHNPADDCPSPSTVCGWWCHCRRCYWRHRRSLTYRDDRLPFKSPLGLKSICIDVECIFLTFSASRV